MKFSLVSVNLINISSGLCVVPPLGTEAETKIPEGYMYVVLFIGNAAVIAPIPFN